MPSRKRPSFTLQLLCFSLLTALAGCQLAPFDKLGLGKPQQPDAVQTPTIEDAPDTLPDDSEPEQPIESVSAPEPIIEPPSKPIEPTTLLNLIIGEMAVHERNIDLASEKYVSEAQLTRDPAVAARAARLARYQRNPETALAMAKLWYEVAPDDENAMANYADMLARVDQPLAALDILEQQLALMQPANFSVLRNSAFKRNPGSLKQTIARLEALDQQQQNFSLVLSHTLLLQKNGQHQAALQQLEKLQQFESDPIQLAVLESRLLGELERYREAASVLEDALQEYPDERRLKLPYAQMLANFDVISAEQQFSELLVATPDDTKLLISHAVTALENKNYPAAQQSLLQLLVLNRQTDFANFNLGVIEQKNNAYDSALMLFKKVGHSKYFMPATQSIVELFIQRNELSLARDYLYNLRSTLPQQAPVFWMLEANALETTGNTEEAHQVLSTAIKAFPEQQALRIDRSSLSVKLDKIDLAESDLRFALKKDPSNPMLLNALGYTLADRTERYNEALDLINQAIALLPDDPAIRDSLGWVQFKLGKIDSAEKNLLLAYDMLVEDEVAAHLIELYWSTGQKRSARKIFRSISKKPEPHPMVDSTLERLNIHF
jgi:tetratricopeptide (TPR) repeat protein